MVNESGLSSLDLLGRWKEFSMFFPPNGGIIYASRYKLENYG